jgi:hypothetical protein
MTRERMIEILAEELERAESLPPNAASHIVNHGPRLQAALNAMWRAVEEDRDPLQ